MSRPTGNLGDVPTDVSSDVIWQLPRGPHELSRDEVEQSQRQRMLLAMADAVGEKGYVKTSVADVLKRAGVSRATFYAQFSDKEDCFVAAFASIASMLTDVLSARVRALRETQPDLDPLGRVDLILSSYLTSITMVPSFAKTFLIEVYAAGPRAIEQRRASVEGFVDLILEALDGATFTVTDVDRRFAVQAIVGSISSLVTNMVGAGEIDRLPELYEPFMGIVRSLVSVP